MQAETLLPILMFVSLFILILLGYPVAFTLAGTAILFGYLGYLYEIFYWSDFGFIPAKVFAIVSNFTLMAVPLFVCMGITLEKSGIAEELLHCMEALFARIKGGLMMSVVIAGALLAASTGIIGATVVTMGALSLPTLLERGYNKPLACGTIATAGTLGQIIPPSIVLVLLGDMMHVDVGSLFAGAIVPGVLLVSLYLAYIAIRAYSRDAPSHFCMRPDDCSPLNLSPSLICSSLLPPTLLVLLVLGTILCGIASPTEAAACGAVGALVLAISRRKLTRQTLRDILERTTSITTMVFTLLVGAQFFSVVFRGLYGDELIADFISDLELNKYLLLFIMLSMLFLLGFFLDFIEICFIVVPIMAPLMKSLGFDPVWLAVLIAINLQTSFLTPPFGFALFYLKGVAPTEVNTIDIYKGVIPFIAVQLLALGVLASFPGLVLWLPELVFGRR